MLSSPTAQTALKTLVHLFEVQGVTVDSRTISKGYICVRLVARYQHVNKEIISNVRKVHLPQSLSPPQNASLRRSHGGLDEKVSPWGWTHGGTRG